MPAFNCVARLNEAAGRTLSDSEVSAIFERVHKAALDIKAGRTKPQPGRAGIEGVIDAAAQEAAVKMAQEAARHERNAGLQVVKTAQRMDDLAQIKAAGLGDLDALSRMIANRADGRANVFSLENRYLGIAADMKRRIQDTWLALGNDFMGFLQDPEKVKLLVREMRGEHTGDAMAKKGAEAWLAMTSEFKDRFNESGGKIGTLENWGMPQHHSQELVARAGKQTWIDAVLPALDRSKYVNDAGVPMTDAQVRDFLGHAWDTIATGGYANIEPGKFQGTGARANRNAEERQIHFKSADAYLNYWAHFGERTFPDILMGHVEAMARDTAFIEHFGPNPDATYRMLRDTALRDASIASPTKLQKIKGQVLGVDALYDVASGRTQPVANRTVAKVFDTIRDLNVAGKLGQAVWASVFGDKVMLETMNHLNNLPLMQSWRNEMRILNPANAADRRILQRQGLMLDYARNAMARWGDNYGSSAWSGKLANAVMRISGMNAINEWRRGSFGLTMMSALGHEVSTKDFRQMKGVDGHLLKSYGIDEGTWKVWKLAQLEDYGHGNTTMLTPDAIARIPDAALKKANIIAQADTGAEAKTVRQQAITRLLGAVTSESHLAIVEPGWRERAQIMSKNPRGTLQGELARAFWQFKTFPLAQFERMWDVSMSRPTTGGKVGTLSAIMAMQILAGAMIVETRDMLSGKDPRPMDWKFGLQAFLQGGALGIYGDFIYGFNETRYGTGPLEVAAGPTIGPALDLMTSTMTAAKNASEGKDTQLAAKYLNIAKGFIPGNNLWYTKAATDHLIFQNIQEQLSPGYLAHVRNYAMKNYGQQYWWQPGEAAPERAPDLTAAFGGK